MDALADGAVQSDRAHELVVLRRSYRRVLELPSLDRFGPDLERGLIKIDDLICASLLKTMKLAGESDALQLIALFAGRFEAALRFGLLERDAIPFIKAS